MVLIQSKIKITQQIFTKMSDTNFNKWVEYSLYNVHNETVVTPLWGTHSCRHSNTFKIWGTGVLQMICRIHYTAQPAALEVTGAW